MRQTESVTLTSTKIPIRVTTITALILIASVFTASCSQPTPVPTRNGQAVETEYIGRVIDATSKLPIDGAKVSLDLQAVPQIVYTDSEGVYRFRLSIPAHASGSVRVDAPGYLPYTRNINISPEIPIIEDIRLTPREVVSIPVSPQKAPTSTATQTPSATLTPTVTLIPPQTSTVTALAPENFGGLRLNCIPDRYWDLVPSAQVELADGCLQLGGWGLHADDQTLNFILPSKDVRGLIDKHLFLPLSGDTDISFRMRIQSIMGEFKEKAPLLTIGICNMNNPDTATNSIMYSFREDGSVLWGVINNDYNLIKNHHTYLLDTFQEFIIRIRSYDLTIEQKSGDPKDVLSMKVPPEDLSALCIRYALPVFGELIATMDNLLVEEK
jgi:hypothetical protein